jgi:hypothetical protein
MSKYNLIITQPLPPVSLSLQGGDTGGAAVRLPPSSLPSLAAVGARHQVAGGGRRWWQLGVLPPSLTPVGHGETTRGGDRRRPATRIQPRYGRIRRPPP